MQLIETGSVKHKPAAIVVSVATSMRREQIEETRKQFEAAFPKVPVIIVPGGINVGVLNATE